ncbi:MAG TPA: hypothetical protein VKE51_39585 [Vicinamibacterales bacterium]|nr:hypothetical protein [Vicinamibacterales bacterium]
MKKPADDQVEPDEHKRYTPEAKEQRRVRPKDQGFPKNGESAPYETEGDEERVTGSESNTLTGLSAPQQTFAAVQLPQDVLLGLCIHG